MFLPERINQRTNRQNPLIQRTHHSNRPPGSWAVNYSRHALHTPAKSGPGQFINWSLPFPPEQKGSIGRLLWALLWDFSYISHNLCVELNTCPLPSFRGSKNDARCVVLMKRKLVCVPENKLLPSAAPIDLDVPLTYLRLKYLFSVQCQIEPSIIIVYPWVRVSPKRRSLLSGWTPRDDFHYSVRSLMQLL